jgi:hypothetical protein
MPDYIKSLLRMCILFILVFAAFVLAKPKPALAANQDCCEICANRFQACVSTCTTGTPLQIAACMSGCRLQAERCSEICPACE